MADGVYGADAPDAAPDSPEAGAKADKTGTNPLNFQKTISLKNEYNDLGGVYANFTRFVYAYPLLSNLKLSAEIPWLASDASGSDEFGLSDIVGKSSWIPYATRTMGVALGADLAAPTASDEVLGTEMWVLAPSLTAAFFLPNNAVFAPAYKHAFNCTDDDGRADINAGTLDFYLVKKFDRNRQWLTFDPTFLFDYESDRYESATVRVNYGRVLAKVGDGVLSGFIKPGVGIGTDRPSDWSFEIGTSLIGF